LREPRDFPKGGGEVWKKPVPVFPGRKRKKQKKGRAKRGGGKREKEKERWTAVHSCATGFCPPTGPPGKKKQERIRPSFLEKGGEERGEETGVRNEKNHIFVCPMKGEKKGGEESRENLGAGKRKSGARKFS